MARSMEELVQEQISALPPWYVPGIGAGEFLQVGEELVRLCRRYGLRRSDRFLDVGCGLGRAAIPLQLYLSGGRYEGIDVVPEIVEWCRRHIASVSSRFRFSLIDVRNTAYNPGGSISGEVVTFPFPARSFDFAFASSLFSHLLESTARRYLQELARVLRPSGHLLFTCFLLDSDTERRMILGQTDQGFFPCGCHTGVADLADPEAAVAFQVTWLLQRLEASGLCLAHPIEVGGWRGGSGWSYQDVVAVRPLQSAG
jgi:SAM-dependent methyltransferase